MGKRIIIKKTEKHPPIVEMGDYVIIDDEPYVVALVNRSAETCYKLVCLMGGDTWRYEPFQWGISVEELKEYILGMDEGFKNIEEWEEEELKIEFFKSEEIELKMDNF